MVCFKYTPHTNYDIRYEVSQGVSMCPKTVSSCPQSISRCPESISRCPHFFQAHLEYWHKGSLWGCESSRFGFTTAKNIMKQNQNYSIQTCGSNVMENILFMAAIFKNGSHFEFLFFKSVDDKQVNVKFGACINIWNIILLITQPWQNRISVKKIGVSGKVKLWRFSQFRLGGFLRTFLCYRLYVSETKTVTKPCSLF